MENKEKTAEGYSSIAFVLHSIVWENDPGTEQLYSEMMERAREYVAIRRKWNDFSPQELKLKNAERSQLHDLFICSLDKLAEYLGDINSRKAIWRASLGNDRRRLGEFAEYLVTVEEQGLVS